MRNIFAAQAISFVLSAPIPPIQPILPPPPIDLQKNIWFAHIHKAAGTSWIDEMKRLVARPCDDFPVCCKVRDNDERVIEESRQWWFSAGAPRTNCTFRTSEDTLPQLMTIFYGTLHGPKSPEYVYSELRVARNWGCKKLRLETSRRQVPGG